MLRRAARPRQSSPSPHSRVRTVEYTRHPISSMTNGCIIMRNAQKNTRFFSTPLLFMASIAMVVLSFIGMTKAHMFAQAVTADPSIGYAPDSYIHNPHISEWFLGTPVLWPIPILFAIIIAIARSRGEYDPYDFLAWFFTIWSSLALTAIFLLTGISETVDAKEDTFSTWVEQRYGIEIEEPPMTDRFLSREIDTEAEVVLDDGQAIGLEEYKDARGHTAYIIVDRTPHSASEELEVIVSD